MGRFSHVLLEISLAEVSEVASIAGTIIAGTVIAGTIIAGTVIAGTIIAGMVIAGTIIAGTIIAGTVIAGTIIAGTTVAVVYVEVTFKNTTDFMMNNRNGVDFRPDEGGRYIVKTRTFDAECTWRNTTSRPSKDWAGVGVVEHSWNGALYITPTPPPHRSLLGRWRKLYPSGVMASTTASSFSVSHVSVRQITSKSRSLM